MSVWTDREILTALDLRDHEGLTLAAIAERFGRGRGAVAGVFSRIEADTDRSDNGHLNGTMPRAWWRR